MMAVGCDVQPDSLSKETLMIDLNPEFRQDHADVLKRCDKSKSYQIFSVCPNEKPGNTIKNMI